jgi:hypothetical protein
MAPKVDCIDGEGRFCYLFYSNDHEPPHVHVRRRGEWEIRVKFLTCKKSFLDYEMVIPKKDALKSADKKEILDSILPVKDQLYREWYEKVLTKQSKL